MVEVYRAPLRSRRDDVDPELTLERALLRGVVGWGGRLSRAPETFIETVRLTAAEHDERTARRLERFAAVPDGAVVWTWEPAGFYRCGTLAGAYEYDGSEAAVAADLVHVRPCAWQDPVGERGVPPAVVASFARGGRNFQRVRAAG